MRSVAVSARQQPSLEQLLGPTLGVVAERQPIPVTEIVRELARQELLGRAAFLQTPNVVNPVGQMVVRATILLKEAGLIEAVAPAVWRLLPAGTRHLKDGKPLTFEALRRKPRYQQYQKDLEAQRRRAGWQELRFDAYASARMLAQQGSAHTAPTSLAYAIEYSMKAALGELRLGLVGRDVLGSHDLCEVYKVCLDHGVLTDTFISDDFLRYARHHFERRYPSGGRKLLEEKGYWTFGPAFLATYDDCFIQIERSLDRLYGTVEWSCGAYALSPRSSLGLARAFFHGNVFAVDRQCDYLATPDDALHRRHQADTLPESPEQLYACAEGLPSPAVAYHKARELLRLDLAALFVCPEANAPHPDPARTYIRPHGPLPGQQTYRWLLALLRREFGFSSVEVVSDRSSNRVRLVVYDRGAKRYWAAVDVSPGVYPTLLDSGFSRDLIKKWIDQVRAQFASERRELRLPPI